VRVRSVLKAVGGLALAALLFFVFGWAPYYLGSIFITRRFQLPDKENAGIDPKALGLAYEPVAFRSSDGVELKGWWVPSDGAVGTAILVHGLNRSRIEMVRKAPFLHEHGWNALLFDLRHHGESGGAATTLGFKEKEDVLAATTEARQRANGPVVLWGVSMGGAAVVLAGAQDPTIAGVVCDSSYRDLPDTARHHVALFRSFRWWLKLVPPWPLTDEALFWMGRLGDFDPRTVDVRAAAERLQGRPALFVANSEDLRMPKEIAFELKKAAGDKAEVLVVPGHSHGGAWRNGTAAYSDAVARLLDEARVGVGMKQVAAR
jgi:pimeloyl-ACP methyl ester carboxylesterase